MSEFVDHYRLGEHTMEATEAELLTEANQSLAESLIKATDFIKRHRDPAVYRETQQVSLPNTDLSGIKQVLPYLPVEKQIIHGREHWQMVRIEAYSYGSGLLRPLAFKIYSAVTDKDLDDMWWQQSHQPEDDLMEAGELGTFLRATVVQNVTEDRPDEGHPVQYQAFGGDGQALDLDQTNYVGYLADLYFHRVGSGINVRLSKYRKFYDVTHTSDSEPLASVS